MKIRQMQESHFAIQMSYIVNTTCIFPFQSYLLIVNNVWPVILRFTTVNLCDALVKKTATFCIPIRLLLKLIDYFQEYELMPFEHS